MAQGPAALGRLQVRQQSLVLAETTGVDTAQRRSKSFEIRYLLPFVRGRLTLPGEQLEALVVDSRAANGLEKMAFCMATRCSSCCFPPLCTLP